MHVSQSGATMTSHKQKNRQEKVPPPSHKEGRASDYKVNSGKICIFQLCANMVKFSSGFFLKERINLEKTAFEYGL